MRSHFYIDFTTLFRQTELTITRSLHGEAFGRRCYPTPRGSSDDHAKTANADRAGHKSNWPAILHDPNESYGYNPMGHVRLLAQSHHISEMDEALRWLNWLNPYQVKLVWWYCDSLRWKTIQRLIEKCGVEKSIRMMQLDLKEAFLLITFALANRVPVRGRTASTFTWPSERPRPIFNGECRRSNTTSPTPPSANPSRR